MDNARDRFVHFQNIGAFRAQLCSPLLTIEQRATIVLLLAEAKKRGDAAGWHSPSF